MTLTLEGDLDILKMELLASGIHNLEVELEKYENVSRAKVKVKMSEVLNYFEHYRNRYSDRAPAVFNL